MSSSLHSYSYLLLIANEVESKVYWQEWVLDHPLWVCILVLPPPAKVQSSLLNEDNNTPVAESQWQDSHIHQSPDRQQSPLSRQNYYYFCCFHYHSVI